MERAKHFPMCFQTEWAFQDSLQRIDGIHHVEDTDLVRMPHEEKSAMFAALRMNQPAATKRLQHL